MSKVRFPDGVIVLDEAVEEDYVPTMDEIEEYAEWLGMDLKNDREFFWIAEKGLKTPLPAPWKPCESEDKKRFYFNFQTCESVWDHPIDESMRALYQSETAKRETKQLEGGVEDTKYEPTTKEVEEDAGCMGPDLEAENDPICQQPCVTVNSSIPQRPVLIIETPGRNTTGLFIILHGAGGSCNCFNDLAYYWATQLPHVKFVLPTGPVCGVRRLSTWFGKNIETNQFCNYSSTWFEILSYIETERQAHSLPLSRVVLLGYSAGALMASWVAMNLPSPCGGVVLLSGSACSNRLQEPQMAPGIQSTPIMYLSGSADVQVPPSCIRRSVESLKRKGFTNVASHESPGLGHEYDEGWTKLILEFLYAILLRDPGTAEEAQYEELHSDIRYLNLNRSTQVAMKGHDTQSTTNALDANSPALQKGCSMVCIYCGRRHDAGIIHQCSSSRRAQRIA